MKLKTIGLGILIFWGLSIGGQAFPASVKWYSYEEGLPLGKNDGKNVLISFYADWCRYCKEMEKTTFKDSAVVNYLDKHFITIRVDFDRKKQIRSLYDVEMIPETWFLTPTGARISHLPGFIPPERLLKVLKYIHTESYKKMTFDKFLRTM